MNDDDPISGLLSLFGLAPKPAQGQQEPSHFDQLFAHWPKAGANPWVHDPSSGATAADPASDTFWGVVKANKEAPTPTPGGAHEAALEATRGRTILDWRDTWTTQSDTWRALTPHQQAAAMALMEADGADPDMARNALATMVNRSAKTGHHLGGLVSSRLYQPSFEPTQHARLGRILAHPKFKELTEWSDRYSRGLEEDPTKGATHFLAHESVMLGLEAKEPRKYRSWRGWTGYDPAVGGYRNVTMRDRGHAFLAPEGLHSIPRLIQDR